MRGLLKTYYQKNGPGGLYSATHQRYKDDEKQGKGSIFSPDHGGHAKYERRNSQDLADGDRPKTKEELKHEKIKERERLRVARAADRREQWISMNVNDPDFVQGIEIPISYIYRFPTRRTTPVSL